MSRTIKFTRAGGPEVLEYVEAPIADPGANEVRIKVKAIGLNRAESMWRRDDYIEPVKMPAGLGYEAAGVVDAVGSDVKGVAIGDAVSVMPSFSMNDYHTYGDVILVPDYAVIKHPETLSFAEAASIWLMFVTVYGALIEDAKVGPGDFVVVPAASSSVGIAAIQVAKYAGATVIALTRTSDKKQQLLGVGAHHVIVTDEQDFAAEILNITGGNGPRVIFDPVGGANFSKLVSLLPFQGIAFIYGLLDLQAPTSLPVLNMIAKNLTVRAHNVWITSGDANRRAAAVEYISKGLASGALKPVIDREFKFEDMVEAHRYLEKNGQFGKIVVTV